MRTCDTCPLNQNGVLERMESEGSGVGTEVVSFLTHLIAKKRLGLRKAEKSKGVPGLVTHATVEAQRTWYEGGEESDKARLAFLRQQRSLASRVDDCVRQKYAGRCAIESVDGNHVLRYLIARNAPLEQE